jgi:hypothetical protein
MEKIKLTLGQVLELDAELNGFIDPQTTEKVLDGFLKQNISMLVRYRMSTLVNNVAAEKATIDKMRDELVTKHGDQTESGYNVVLRLESGEINPKFLDFQREYSEFLTETTDIEYKPLAPKDIEEVVTTENYNILLKLIQE